MEKVTLNEALNVYKMMAHIDDMGEDFIKAVYDNTPEGYEILDVPEHKAMYLKTFVCTVDNKHIVVVWYTNTHQMYNEYSITLDADEYFADHIQCAKNYVANVVGTEDELEDATKQKDLAEYERIKRKYGLE